jgi:hypothetical protein
MKVCMCAIILCFLLTGIAVAQGPAKVTLDAKAMTIKDATDEIAKQSQTAIVLDPKAKGTVTASLNGAELSQALDVVTKSNNLTWKKLEFARKADSKVTLDQLKSGILALASLELVGLSVEDPATKTGAVFAKDIPSAPDTPKLPLPEGYTWTTVYVVLAPEPAADTTAAGKDKVASLANNAAKQMSDVVSLTPEERKQYFTDYMSAQMKMAPEARQSMLRDQMQAVMGMDQQSRDQFRNDMRAVFSNMPHGAMGGGGQGQNHGQGQGQNHGQRQGN